MYKKKGYLLKIDKLTERLRPYVKEHRKRSRIRRVLCLLCACTAICVFAAMVHPGISLGSSAVTNEIGQPAVENADTEAADLKSTGTKTAGAKSISTESVSTESADTETTTAETEKTASETLLTAQSTETTLDDYITSASFTDGSGKTITTAKVGDTVNVAINYTIPAKTLSSTDKTITYQLPDAIAINAKQSGGIFNSAGTSVGTYTISTDGKITITFNDSYDPDSALTGTIKVAGSASNDSTTDSKTATIGGSTITVGPKTVVTHDLYVQKTADTYSKQDGKIHYTITAYTTVGTEDTVNITDTLSNSNITYDQDSFVITGPDGNTLSSAQYPVYFDSNNNTFSIYYLPKLSAGQEYTITYTASPNWSGTTDISESVNNSAKATSGGDTYTAYAGTTLSLLNKSGYYDTKTGKIEWTITVNNSHTNLNGYTLSDVLTNPDGTKTEITGAVTISPALNGSDTITLPYTFSGDDYNTYKITYTTTPDSTSIGSRTYSNDAILTKGTESHTAPSGNVTVTGTGNVTKTWDSETAAAGKDGAYYNWTSTLVVPSSGLTTEAYYQDFLDGQSGKLLITKDTAPVVVTGVSSNGATAALVEGTDYSITFYKDSTYKDQYNGTSGMQSTDSTARSFTIHLLKPIAQSTYSKLVITYGTYADYSVVPAGQSRRYTNEAQYGINNTTYDSTKAYHKYTKTSSIAKQGKTTDQYGNSSFTDKNFTVDYDASGAELYYRLLVNTDKSASGEITITDSLPAGTEFDESSFKCMFYFSKYTELSDVWINAKDIIANDIVHHTLSAVKNADGTTTLTITIDDQYGTNAMSIYYGVKVTDQKNGTTAYTNTATLGTSTVSQTTSVNHKIVSKSAEQGDGTSVSSNIVTYRVVLNPEGADLDAKADTLTLVDQLTFTASQVEDLHLVQDSVKLYQYDSTAANHEGAQLDSSLVSYQYDAANQQTTFTIPDGKAVVLEYQYYVKQVSSSTAVKLSNSASLSGVTGGSDSHDISVKVNSSSATADQKILTICKVDADNNATKLPGAVFTLYKWDDSQWTTVGTYTTDQNGVIKFDAGTADPIITPGLTLYQLSETTAPEGYAAASPYCFVWGPDGYTVATLTSAMADTVKEAGASNVQYFLNYGGTAYIKDVRNSIQVKKVWLTTDGTTDTYTHAGITVQLYNEAGDSVGDAVVLSQDNSWSHTWENLTAGTTYTVKEMTGEKGYTVSYDNNGIAAGTITVKNTGAPVTEYTLPETGGTGTLPFIVSGSAMMLLPAAYAVRRKKRHSEDI